MTPIVKSFALIRLQCHACQSGSKTKIGAAWLLFLFLADITATTGCQRHCYNFTYIDLECINQSIRYSTSNLVMFWKLYSFCDLFSGSSFSSNSIKSWNNCKKDKPTQSLRLIKSSKKVNFLISRKSFIDLTNSEILI